MKKLPIIDAFFLINESRRTPMHVGGCTLYTLPDGVDEIEFLHDVSSQLFTDQRLRHPFGKIVNMGKLGSFGPMYWDDDPQFDMDYHLRHSALPKPGRYRELFALVSRLHGQLLDRQRPLWEMHLIEGLQNRQIATYFKMHHCAMDGVSSMHFTNSFYSANPDDRMKYSPFSQEAYEAYKRTLGPRSPRREPQLSDLSDLAAVSEFIREQLGSGINVAKALGQFAGVWLGVGGNLEVFWHHMPHTPFNTKLSGARRFVAQTWAMDRVMRVAKAFGATFNDTICGMVAGALRHYLVAAGQLPDKSMKTMAPVSFREKNDIDSANAIGFITIDLGTNEKDPAKRMDRIMASAQAGKRQLKGMSKREVELYTAITHTPFLLSSLLGLGSKFPAVSTVVSNVPGPSKQMYWNGASVDGIYPTSIPFDGFALNFTLVTNNGGIDMGIMACRRSVPHVQRLIDYMEEALVELEEAAGLTASASKEPTKQPGTKKPVAKKLGVKKSPAKKAPAKKQPAGKTPVEKTPVKKTPVKKTAAKKSTVKKPAVKKSPAKKAPVKKPPAKKAQAKAASATPAAEKPATTNPTPVAPSAE